MRSPRTALPLLALAALVPSLPAPLPAAEPPPARIMEKLGRGVVAVQQADGSVFISWRLLATDPAATAFNLYRTTAANPAAPTEAGPFGSRPDPVAGTVKLNAEPLATVTWFLDTTARLERETAYFVRPVVDGRELDPSAPFTFPANAAPQPYLSIPLDTPPGYTPGDASAGDLDGDGEYELVLKQEQRPQDNSRSGITGDTLLQAYKLDGRRLWTIHLGKNIREGAHYTQFMVYDLDSDGRAEVACKTADGTLDGTGKPIGDPAADWRSLGSNAVPTSDPAGAQKTVQGLVARTEGTILRGPEYLTIFDGRTGAALATTDYVPGRHPDTQDPTPEQMKAVWGDSYGNRSERYLACVAYLDGVHPSLVMCRGYYTRAVLAAWDWRDGKLTRRWVFDSNDGTPGNEKYRGQGNHQLSVADVDGDGCDEIVYGACVISHDGKGLYSTGRNHGDALHVGDLDPERPGLEVFQVHEEPSDCSAADFRDARTGQLLWGLPSQKDAGRGLAANIDPRFPGDECWSAPSDGLYSCKGVRIGGAKPHSCNFAIWWDGDLLRELLDQNAIEKWNWQTGTLDPLLVAHACTSNNGTKATPALSADLFGDWREEVVWRTRDNKELRIYTTTIPTKHRLVTLMHDPQYRLAVAWQNVAYNQPPHPSFFIGEGMAEPPRPDIITELPAVK